MALTKQDKAWLEGLFKDAFKDELREEFVTRKEFYEFKDQVMVNFDKVFKLLENLITEVKVLGAQLTRLEKKMEGHEQRVTALEVVTGLAAA